jgi:hypothetical protein
MARYRRGKRPGETFGKRQREHDKKYKGLRKTGRRLRNFPTMAESTVSAEVMGKLELLFKEKPLAKFSEIGSGWFPTVNPSILLNMYRIGSFVVGEYAYVLDASWQGGKSIRFKVVTGGKGLSEKAPYRGTFLVNLGELTIERLSG